MDLAGLHVFGTDPVVADQGPRHAHHLAVIGGIGKNLLIPGHAGVENDFPAALAGPGKERPSSTKPSSRANSAFIPSPLC